MRTDSGSLFVAARNILNLACRNLLLQLGHGINLDDALSIVGQMSDDLVAEQVTHLLEREAFCLREILIQQRKAHGVARDENQIVLPSDRGECGGAWCCVHDCGDEVDDERYGEAFGSDGGWEDFCADLDAIVVNTLCQLLSFLGYVTYDKLCRVEEQSHAKSEHHDEEDGRGVASVVIGTSILPHQKRNGEKGQTCPGHSDH